MRRIATKLAATFAAGFLTLGLSAQANAVPADPPPQPEPEVKTTSWFNSPGDTNMVTKLVDLIEGAPAGSEIRVAAFQIRDDKIVDPLVEAADRGVDVKVVADGRAGKDDGYKKLVDGIGDDTDKVSWVKLCDGNNACIGDVEDKGDDTGAVQHSKFFLFSRTKHTSDVSVLPTANISKTMGGSGGWNSAYVDAEGDGLYDRHKDYFEALVDGTKNRNYYEEKDAKPTVTGDTKSYFFPRAKHKGYDTVVNSLAGVDCKADPTTIRVSNWYLARAPVAKKLRELSDAGCNVDIVLTRMAVNSCEELTDGSAADTLSIRGFREGDYEQGNHEKNMMIDGNYYGRDTKVTFTGTHNLVPSSLRQNDENMVRIENAKIHDKFVENFENVKDAAKLKVNLDRPTADCRALDPKKGELKRGDKSDLRRGGKGPGDPQPKGPGNPQPR